MAKARFKKGEDVVIARSAYKCMECGQKHGKYYHGGRFSEVGLKSHGQIVEVRSLDKILLRLKNGKEWWVHPDEINLRHGAPLVKLKRFLPGIENIPKHPVFELAEQSPVFIFNETAYSVGNGRVFDGKNFYEQKEGRKTTKKSLEEIGDLDSLDALAFDRAYSEIEVLGEKYAKDVQKKLNILSRLDGAIDIPQLIYKQVFPYLQNGHIKDKITQLLGSKNKKTSAKKRQKNLKVTKKLEEVASSVCTEVNSLIEQIEKEEQEQESPNRSKKQRKIDSLFCYQEPKPYLGTSFLGKALNGRDVVIMNGEIYNLAPYKGGKFTARVNLEGKKVRVGEDTIRKTKDVEERLLSELSKKVRADALREHLSENKIKDILGNKDAELLEVAGKSGYKGNGFGFAKNNGSYYVYLEVPAFAIKSQFDDNYYLFDKTRIATKVNKNGKELSYDRETGNYSGLVLIENNNHPFLHHRRGGFASLCTGYLTLPTSGKDNGEVIAKRLRRGREMLMFGYAGTDYASEYELKERYFGENKVSLTKLKKLKVPIIQGGPRR